VMSRVLLLVVAVEALHTPRLHGSHVIPAPRISTIRCAESGEAFDSPVPAAADLVAQSSGNVAVSGLTPQGQQQQQQQQYVSVPPTPVQTPTLLQKARTPFLGFTLLASAAVAAWQSNKVYLRRQSALIDDFARNMVFHLGDDREMATCYKCFKQQLGPGRYTPRMYEAFLTLVAKDRKVRIQSIQELKSANALFGLTDEVTAELLEKTADTLQGQPSVLGKLTFLSERAMPMAASMAKLRTKFPNWSFDTVTSVQRAMLENLFREMCEDLPPGTNPDSTTLELLGLSESEATRLMVEVQQRKEAEEAAEAAAAEEELRALKLQRELERAAEMKTVTTRATTSAPVAEPPVAAPKVADADESGGSSDIDPGGSPVDDVPEDVDRASGTHEYECTKCGYVLFPAAGREFKFFGEGFTCPGCGSGKEAFVDNGPVE